MRDLETIAAEIRAHKNADCGFEPCATCTQFVPGAGDPNASILFIGEAPGKKEDELGVPFIGAAGKFLDELLASIELSRDDVFIANVLKARPPDNRDPLPAEVAHHWPWLEEQIAAINPDLIIPLGRHAMARFLPNRVISRDHGQPRLKNGQVYLPVYHPAAALYNGSLRGTLIEDFAQIPQLLERIQETGRDELMARSAPDLNGVDDHVAAEFADPAEAAVVAGGDPGPGVQNFGADGIAPLDGMAAARMVNSPAEQADELARDEPPQPAPGQPGLF
jgi:uracil-DNA glycosylase family 4